MNNNKPNRKNKKSRNNNTTVKEDCIELDGVVLENLSNNRYDIKLDDSGTNVIAYLSGKMRTRYIRIQPGDKVRVSMSPYDLTRGRIIYRQK